MEPRRDEAPGQGREGFSRHRASLARVGGRGEGGRLRGLCAGRQGAPPPSPFPLLGLLLPPPGPLPRPPEGPQAGGGGHPKSGAESWGQVGDDLQVPIGAHPRGWLQSRFSESPTPKAAGSAGVNLEKGGSPKGPWVSGSPAPLGFPFSGSQRQVGARPPCPQAVEPCAGQEGGNRWSQSHRRYPRFPSPQAFLRMARWDCPGASVSPPRQKLIEAPPSRSDWPVGRALWK